MPGIDCLSASLRARSLYSLPMHGRARKQHLRAPGLVLVSLLALALAGCDADLAFFIDVVTDLEPGTDFDLVETSLYGQGSGEVLESASFAPEPGSEFLVGARVAEFSGNASGDYRVEVVLSLAGVEVARAGNLAGELDFGGGTRAGPLDYLVVLRD